MTTINNIPEITPANNVFTPELLDCLRMIKTVTDRLYAYNEKHPQMVEDSIDDINTITEPLNDIAGNISELIRYEMLENIYFNIKTA